MQGLDIPCVRTDNYEAARELTELLIRKGHKKLCFVTHSTMETSTIMKRYHAFRDCAAMHPDVYGTFRELSGYETNLDAGVKRNYDISEVKEIVKQERNTAAFFAVEYKIAILLDRACKELGLSREITTFDGVKPMLDDRHHFIQAIQDEYQMGQEAVGLLMRKMNGEEAGVGASVYIPHHIYEDGKLQ